MRRGLIRQSEHTAFLKSVPTFKGLEEPTIVKIAGMKLIVCNTISVSLQDNRDVIFDNIVIYYCTFSDVLEEVTYKAGEYIVRQGAGGDTFFIISKGSVQVTKNVEKGIDALFFYYNSQHNLSFALIYAKMMFLNHFISIRWRTSLEYFEERRLFW